VIGLSSAWRQVPLAVTLAAAVTFTALQYGTFSGTGEGTVEQVARAVQSARRGNEPIGTHQVFVRNLVYYTRFRTMDLIGDDQLSAFLASPNRVLVVAPAEAVDRMERDLKIPLRRLAEFPYFNEAGIRLRTLLQPDLSRDITRVVLISNR
jgi:hypothetical protein